MSSIGQVNQSGLCDVGFSRLVRDLAVRGPYPTKGSILKFEIDRMSLLQGVPHTAPAAVLLQMVATGQATKVLLEGVAAGTS